MLKVTIMLSEKWPVAVDASAGEVSSKSRGFNESVERSRSFTLQYAAFVLPGGSCRFLPSHTTPINSHFMSVCENNFDLLRF